MKILLVSDVESPYIWDHFNPDKFKDIELIISCGDLRAEYLSFLVTMIKAPLYYIHGNHDKKYIENPPDGCDCIEDRIVKYKGIRIAGLGGCKGFNKQEFQYSEEDMGRRLKKLKPHLLRNKGLDILVTHSAGYGVGDDTDPCHEGFKGFNKLLDAYSPRYFVHGHIHLNYVRKPRTIEYNDTKVINAYEYHIFEY
jgi:uncharacterized protein